MHFEFSRKNRKIWQNQKNIGWFAYNQDIWCQNNRIKINLHEFLVLFKKKIVKFRSLERKIWHLQLTALRGLTGGNLIPKLRLLEALSCKTNRFFGISAPKLTGKHVWDDLFTTKPSLGPPSGPFTTARPRGVFMTHT